MIGLDWDGVLIDHPPNISFEEILTYGPMKDAVKTINYLVDSGFDFAVITARRGKELIGVRKWMKRYGFPKMKVTNKKLNCSVYIDDRGLRFTNWTDISKYFR